MWLVEKFHTLLVKSPTPRVPVTPSPKLIEAPLAPYALGLNVPEKLTVIGAEPEVGDALRVAEEVGVVGVPTETSVTSKTRVEFAGILATVWEP